MLVEPYMPSNTVWRLFLPASCNQIFKDFTNITDLKKWMSLTFVNNTAKYAGSVLYGGSIDHCYTYQHFVKYSKKSHIASYYNFPKIVHEVFHFTWPADDSPISSDPLGVCLCNESGYHNCSIKNHTFPRSIYPGEAFNISAVAVGQWSGDVCMQCVCVQQVCVCLRVLCMGVCMLELGQYTNNIDISQY